MNVAKNVDCNKIPPKMRDGEDDIANKKSRKTAEKMFQTAFRCCKHLKAGRITQQTSLTESFYLWWHTPLYENEQKER